MPGSVSERENVLAWAVLVRTPGLNAAVLAAALEVSGHAAALLRSSAAELGRSALPASARAYLAGPAAAPTLAEQRWLDAPRHHLLPFTDRRYPGLLRSLPDAPIALYVSGRIDALAEPQLAIVGSRCPSPQGRETATAFAAALGECGLGITSGLAEGIDSCAHRGALEAGAITVGVLGTGIDGIYPRGNRHLHQDIERTGALISEFAPGTPPRKGNFPQRNRLIAALSLGTLVVEAAQRSGSLITARLANAYGREVFAIPGSIYNPLSRGCHELIKMGSTLVETTADILRELNYSAFFAQDLPPPQGALGAGGRASGMDKDHKILLDALGFDPVDLDTLVVRTGFKPEAVSSMMLILELEGHVQTGPGGRHSRVAYRRAGGER